MKSDDRLPEGNPQECDAERQNLATCAKNSESVEDASGFEPEDHGLEVPGGFLTPTSICRTVAVLFFLYVSGVLDADSALVLGQVLLP